MSKNFMAMSFVLALAADAAAAEPSPPVQEHRRSEATVNSTADAQPPQYIAVTFDTDDVGKPPRGFIIDQTHPGDAKGIWTVVADTDARSRPNVLRLATKNSGSTYNLAAIAGPSYGDLDLRVDIRADTGDEDQGGGLVWRFKDANNYYICRINPLERNFRVYKVVDGRREQLASADIDAKAGTWYALRAVMQGDRMRCYVDGERLLDVSDDTFPDPGMIGLWTKADASSSFDNLTAYRRVSNEDAGDAGQVHQPEKPGADDD